jgi:DNA-binding winged helix-turn-helix (wHTH) protein
LSRVITLDEFLIFEPDKKRITGRGRPAIISASASLCLQLMIENAGHLVTHQQFYDYVWRRFGTEPTSTSLYQNISALRHAFNKAGLQEDIIRTMPRKGFLLSPQTTISRESIPASVAVTGQAEDVHAFRPVEKIDTTSGEAFVSEAPSEEDNKLIRSGWSKFTCSAILYGRHFKSPLTVKKMLITGCLSVLFFSFLFIFPLPDPS